MSFKKTFLRNLFVSGGFTYLAQLVTFLASFITSRLLSPKDFGLVGLIAVFSGFITIFSDSGISMAVIRSPFKETYYRGLHYLSIIIGACLTVISILLIYPIALFYDNRDIILPGIAIAFLFIIKSFSIVPIAVLQKELRFGAAGRAVFISTLIGTISTIVMAFTGFKFWSLIWSQYVTAVISGILLYSNSSAIFKKTKLSVVKKSFLLAKRLIGSLIGFNMINYWARNADNLIVGKYYGTAELGIYNRAYMMLQIPLNLITGIFSTVLLPSFIKHKEAGGDMEQEYYFILKIISILNLPVAIILLLFPDKLVMILWGPNWIAVAKLLPYFGLLVLTQTLTSTQASILVILKFEKDLMFLGWINSAFMVTGIIIGATISLTSIAAFYSLSYILLVLPLYIFYLFNYKLRSGRNALRFWLPKLFLSAFIWSGIYYSVFPIVLCGLILWTIIILWDARSGLAIVSKRFLPGLSKT
ncbi:oligosaccharide flippase family protein [Panacibacter ginsenosidivorans]|uniref:Oligosaccharide flippase family protein n=1 Tax=Panacibacter ginsenosidivorans TaxID=1813871 RepID=A0A5B8VCK1_9BACT|nr:oligosaccharide flippase family protein [Panacibacter ginsenosidivorans]QEC68028.1 oligosaccharide flippase family protein [Panacibacter ginsenosidivorans]